MSGLRLTSVEGAPSRGLVGGLAAGVLAGLALVVVHAPVGASIVAPFVPVLFWTAVRLAPARAGRMGAVAGFVGHAVLLSWILPPAGIAAWFLLSLIQAGWWSLLALAVRPWLDRSWILLIGPVAWVGVDVARVTWPFGGFLWGDLASGTVDWTWLHPLVRVGGAHAATFVVVAVGTAIWFVGDRLLPLLRDDDARGDDAVQLATAATRPGLVVLVGTAVATTMVTLGPPPTEGTMDVLLVQGNDVEDWFGTAGDLDVAIAERMRAQTEIALAEDGPADLVLWPESSIDRDPSRDPTIRTAVDTAAALAEGRLVAGVNLDGDEPRTFRNSAVVYDDDGAEVDRYVKRNLVPFGEYVPFRRFLTWVPPLEQVPRDGVAGSGAQALVVGGTTIAPAICFETMEAGTIRTNILAGEEDAGLIAVFTNDASFGRTGEPAQHLAQARLRAVETGRWVAYGAVSGRSAFVDQDGRVVERTELFTRDHLRREVPLAVGRTPFLAIGDVVGRLSALGWIGLILLAARRRTREVS